MRLKTLEWSPGPLSVELKKASFFFHPQRFPKGTVEFDCALIMRRVPHEWHEIKEAPRLERHPGRPLASACV
jgi:hypothetical protein